MPVFYKLPYHPATTVLCGIVFGQLTIVNVGPERDSHRSLPMCRLHRWFLCWGDCVHREFRRILVCKYRLLFCTGPTHLVFFVANYQDHAGAISGVLAVHFSTVAHLKRIPKGPCSPPATRCRVVGKVDLVMYLWTCVCMCVWCLRCPSCPSQRGPHWCPRRATRSDSTYHICCSVNSKHRLCSSTSRVRMCAQDAFAVSVFLTSATRSLRHRRYSEPS